MGYYNIIWSLMRDVTDIVEIWVIYTDSAVWVSAMKTRPMGSVVS